MKNVTVRFLKNNEKGDSIYCKSVIIHSDNDSPICYVHAPFDNSFIKTITETYFSNYYDKEGKLVKIEVTGEDKSDIRCTDYYRYDGNNLIEKSNSLDSCIEIFKDFKNEKPHTHILKIEDEDDEPDIEVIYTYDNNGRIKTAYVEYYNRLYEYEYLDGITKISCNQCDEYVYEIDIDKHPGLFALI